MWSLPNKVAHIKEYLKKAGYTANVMASVGHIAEIRNGGNYYNTGIDPQNDFKMDLAVSADKRDVVNKLKTQADAADLVYLASDSDNEGAQISWSLIKFLKLPKDKYRRMIMHEITPKAVVYALEHPVALDTDNAMASQARMCLDKILGYRASPIAKTYVGARSVGRCQSVGLKIVVDREREIQNFKPETYFDIYLHFSKNNTAFKAKYIGTEANPIEHLKTQAEVNSVKAACTDDYVVTDINKKEKQDAPKPPFCTATYQQEVASKLGLSVKDAMSVAQKLFESGYITYHRTVDTEMSAEFVDILKPYIETTYGKTAYVKPRVGKKQGDEQNGHECLRITDPSVTPELFAKMETNNLQQKVYKMVWQRTVAAALENAIISETSYTIFNKEQLFQLVSNEVTKEGYRTVYSYKDDDADDDNGPVKETFAKGEKLLNTKLEDVCKQTKAPARYSEATLIKALEKNGCGRPSTYATIVETVLSESRGYAKKDGKVIVPTDKGMQLAEFLDRAFSNIINLNYTKEMEEELDKIATGKLTKTAFLTTFYNDLENTIKASPELKATVSANVPTCPKCGAPMVVRRSKYGKMFYGCSNYPKCNGIVNMK